MSRKEWARGGVFLIAIMNVGVRSTLAAYRAEGIPSHCTRGRVVVKWVFDGIVCAGRGVRPPLSSR
jgi:hypothetical protein